MGTRSNIRTHAAGVAILLHKRYVESVEVVHSISERGLAIDLRMRRGFLRFVAAYTPRTGYSQATLDLFYFQFHSVRRARDVMKNDMACIVGGDFNAQLNVGNRTAECWESWTVFG